MIRPCRRKLDTFVFVFVLYCFGSYPVLLVMGVVPSLMGNMCVYVCMYVCGQIAQVVEHQTADPWVAGSSLTSGEKCKNC